MIITNNSITITGMEHAHVNDKQLACQWLNMVCDELLDYAFSYLDPHLVSKLLGGAIKFAFTTGGFSYFNIEDCSLQLDGQKLVVFYTNERYAVFNNSQWGSITTQDIYPKKKLPTLFDNKVLGTYSVFQTAIVLAAAIQNNGKMSYGTLPTLYANKFQPQLYDDGIDYIKSVQDHAYKIWKIKHDNSYWFPRHSVGVEKVSILSVCAFYCAALNHRNIKHKVRVHEITSKNCYLYVEAYTQSGDSYVMHSDLELEFNSQIPE